MENLNQDQITPTNEDIIDNELNTGMQRNVGRRTFLQGLAALGGAALVASATTTSVEAASAVETKQFGDFLNADFLADEEKAEFPRFKSKCINLLAAMNAHEPKKQMDQASANRFLYYSIVEFKTAESQMVGERDGKKVVRPVSYTTPARVVINQVAINGKTNGELGKDGEFTRIKYIISKNGHAAITAALEMNGAPTAYGANAFYDYLNNNYYREKFEAGEVFACVDSTKVKPANFSAEQARAYGIWQSLNGQPSDLVTLMDNTLPGFDPNEIPDGYDKEGFNPKTLFEEGKNFKKEGF